MNINSEHLPTVFQHAKQVRVWLAAHCKGPDKTPVSLDDIIESIKAIYGVTIETRLVRFDSDQISGFIEIYEGRAVVYLDSNLNLAVSRYVFVKEVCHIMLLTQENATRDPVAMIEYYVHDREDADPRSHPADVVCEEVTKHGALELLYPPILRKEHKAMISKNEVSIFAISESLQLPEYLVEYCLRDHYMDTCEGIRGDQPDKERFRT